MTLRSFLAAVSLAVLAACTPRGDRFVAAVRSIEPSVVLLTMHLAPRDPKAHGFDDGYATGFVVASGRWGSDVLTVEHAVEGARDLHVTIANRRRVPARVIARDGDRDLALVRLAVPDLPVARLASPSDLHDLVGAAVGLAGYPIPDEFADEGLGLATSVAAGRLSAVRRGALELMLTIVPGESGGPVFRAFDGAVIGVAESRFDGEPSIGFAVPLSEVRAFLHKTDAVHGF